MKLMWGQVTPGGQVTICDTPELDALTVAEAKKMMDDSWSVYMDGFGWCPVRRVRNLSPTDDDCDVIGGRYFTRIKSPCGKVYALREAKP